MSSLLAIICSSKVEGYVFVNGFVAGPCSKTNSVSIPWDSSTPLFVSFTPIDGDCLPVFLAFADSENLPHNMDTEITLWPGVIDVNFLEKKNVPYPPPLMPKEIQQKNFTVNTLNVRSSLIDYCGIWWVLDSNDSTLMNEYIGDCDETITVDNVQNNPNVLHLSSGNLHALAIYKNDEFSLTKFDSHTARENDDSLIFMSTNKTVNIQTIVSISDSDLKINKEISEYTDDNDIDIIGKFLTGILINNIDDAYMLLDDSLKNVFRKNEILDYIGPFDRIGETKYINHNYPLALTVFEKESASIYKAKSFAFEVNSNKMICNIAEI